MSTNNGAIRWTIQRAAVEFGVHRETLSKYLRRESIHPGKDGKYSTQDICSAVFGGIHGERLRKTRAECELLEMELAKERSQYIHRERAYELLENVFLAVRSKIVGSHLSPAEQDSILLDLYGLREAKF